jgi:hypothetical protein
MSGGQGFLVEKPPQLEDASRESVEKFIAARKKYGYVAGALAASAKMGASQAVLQHIGALSFGLAGASTSGYGDGRTRQEQIDNCEW